MQGLKWSEDNELKTFSISIRDVFTCLCFQKFAKPKENFLTFKTSEKVKDMPDIFENEFRIYGNFDDFWPPPTPRHGIVR